jgi:hypothetical protein
MHGRSLVGSNDAGWSFLPQDIHPSPLTFQQKKKSQNSSWLPLFNKVIELSKPRRLFFMACFALSDHPSIKYVTSFCTIDGAPQGLAMNSVVMQRSWKATGEFHVS